MLHINNLLVDLIAESFVLPAGLGTECLPTFVTVRLVGLSRLTHIGVAPSLIPFPILIFSNQTVSVLPYHHFSAFYFISG
jgi:hypothetical protein